MKKNLLLASLLFLGLSFTFLSCDKDDVTLNNGAEMFNIKTLFEGLKSQAQVFNVTAGQASEIIGASGTKIVFHPQTFRNASGQVISSGNIKIELTEVYKPAQMMANRVFTTTSNHKMLRSGGAVNIKATLNGTEVFATGGYDLSFRQDEDSDQPMALFTGIPMTDSNGTAIIWSESSTNEVERTIKDANANLFYYAFDSCTNFNWINCDYFYNTTMPKTDISIVAPDSTFNTANTEIFIIFRDINSVSGMYAYNATTHTFNFGYSGYYIPVGTVVDIVIVSGKNNTYFMDVKQGVILTNNISVNFTPMAQTLSTIQTTLSTL